MAWFLVSCFSKKGEKKHCPQNNNFYRTIRFLDCILQMCKSSQLIRYVHKIHKPTHPIGLETTSSTCGSGLDSRMMLYTSSNVAPCKNLPFHSNTSSPRVYSSNDNLRKKTNPIKCLWNQSTLKLQWTSKNKVTVMKYDILRTAPLA